MLNANTRFYPEEVSRYYSARLPHMRQTKHSHWRTQCPIHQGKKLSFSVNSSNGVWFCHSQCQRGDDIINLEMLLSEVDFITARNAVFDIIGRSIPQPKQFSVGEWEKIRADREAKERDTEASGCFFIACRLMAEKILEELPTETHERFALTKLIADVRADSLTVYREYRRKDAKFTEGLVWAGRRYIEARKKEVWAVVSRMAEQQEANNG